jgi:iron complex outermembrane recepter protein
MQKLCLAVFLLMSMNTLAQVTISGRVQDSNEQALVGATIQLESTRQFAVTDEFGRFQIGKLKPGEYTLIIKFLGFTDQTVTVSAQANNFVEVVMQESVMITDEVIISATRASDKTPTTFTSINKRSIQKQNFGQDLPFLLNWTPSVVTTSDAGAGVGYTGIRIRGSDATRINVTINGIPYNDAESLGTFWVDIPDIAASSQSIQIQRGVGTSTNGGGAFGASINLQTNTRNDEAYSEVSNSFGSFKTHKHSASFGTGLLNGAWVMDCRVSRILSDGFIDRASSDLNSYYFSAGYYAGKTMLKGIVFGGKERTYQSWYGVPESRLNNDEEAMYATAANEGWNAEQTANLLNSNSRTFNPYTYKNQVDDYKQDHYQLHFSQLLISSLTVNTSLHYTYGRGFYEEYKYDDDFSNYGLSPVLIGDSLIESSDIIRRRWLRNDFYGITYSVNYEKNNVSLVIGGAWNRYDGDHFGEIIWAEVSPVETAYQYYFNNGDKRDLNNYAKVNVQLAEKINAFADLQFRRVTYEAVGIQNKQDSILVDANYNFFNPKLGVSYQLNSNQQVYASYAIAHREPVRDDFAYNQQSPEPEKLGNLEVGYRNSGKRHTIALNTYWMNYRDQLVLTGELNEVGAYIRTNAGKSYRLGLEVEGAYLVSDKITVTANATLSRNKIKKFIEVLEDYGDNFDEFNIVQREYADTDIAFSPSIIAASGLTYKVLTNAEITWLSKYVGKQFLDNTANDNRSIDSYWVNDLRFTYSWKPNFLKELEVSVLVNNIFDRAYESNGYTWGYLGGSTAYRENYYYPQAGRNFMAMLTLRF